MPPWPGGRIRDEPWPTAHGSGMNIRIESLGCRLNIGEMEALGRHLAARGHTLVGPGQQADLCILNTCTVTATAARKSRHLARQPLAAPVFVLGAADVVGRRGGDLGRSK